MDLLKQMIEENGPALLGALTGDAGLSESQAQSLLPEVASGVGQALEGGGLDLGSLLGGDVGKLLQDVDFGALASAAGLSEAQVESGLEALLPLLMKLLGEQTGGAEGLGALLGGDAGKALGSLGDLAKGFLK